MSEFFSRLIQSFRDADRAGSGLYSGFLVFFVGLPSVLIMVPAFVAVVVGLWLYHVAPTVSFLMYDVFSITWAHEDGTLFFKDASFNELLPSMIILPLYLFLAGRYFYYTYYLPRKAAAENPEHVKEFRANAG